MFRKSMATIVVAFTLLVPGGFVSTASAKESTRVERVPSQDERGIPKSMGAKKVKPCKSAKKTNKKSSGCFTQTKTSAR